MRQSAINATLTSHPPESFGQLNGLRGVAALVVIVSHSANAGFLPDIFGRGFGKLGVCLFFILSGFMMSHLYLGKDLSALSFRQYVVKRAARVIPLFFFCLLLTVPAYVLFDRNLYNIRSLQDALGNAFLVHGTSVLWSISVEIHFYVVFAAIWLAFARGVRIISVFATLILMQIITAMLLQLFFSSTNFLPFWIHMFIFGMLTSTAYQFYSLRIASIVKSRTVVGLSWLFVLSIVLVLPEFRRDLGMKTFAPFFDPISVAYTALAFVFALLNIGPFRFLNAKPMQWLGKVSFSLYLLHMPILIEIHSLDAFENIPSLGFITVLSVSILASWLTFNVVERPAQSWLKRFLLSG